MARMTAISMKEIIKMGKVTFGIKAAHLRNLLLTEAYEDVTLEEYDEAAALAKYAKRNGTPIASAIISVQREGEVKHDSLDQSIDLRMRDALIATAEKDLSDYWDNIIKAKSKKFGHDFLFQMPTPGDDTKAKKQWYNQKDFCTQLVIMIIETRRPTMCGDPECTHFEKSFRKRYCPGTHIELCENAKAMLLEKLIEMKTDAITDKRSHGTDTRGGLYYEQRADLLKVAIKAIRAVKV
jgi:hypothetical protein